MESTALLSSLNVIVPWLFQRVIGIFSYLRKEANIGLKMEAKATATRGIFRTSTIFGFKLGEWKTPFWYPDWESRYCLGWGRSYGIGKGMEIRKLFRFSLRMAHVTLLSCLGQSKSMTKPVAMSALHCYPRGRKDPGKVMRIAFSVTVDRRGLQDPWVITSLEKQHPLFQCLQPRTLQFMTASCILYEELRDRSTKILNTMEMLISLSEPSHTVYRSRIITLCLTNTRDKK